MQATKEKSQDQLDAENMTFRRYIANAGIDLPDFDGKSVGGREGLEVRAKLRQVLNKISAKEDNGGITEDEAMVFRRAAEYINNVSSKLDSDEAARRHFTGAGSNKSEWVNTQTGKPVMVLDSKQKLTDDPSQQAGKSSVPFGQIIRAMALGPSAVAPEIRNALTEGTDAAGGYTVPSLLLSEFVDAMRAQQTVIKAGARTVVLEGAKTTSIARLDSDPVAAWRNENAAFAISDPVFSNVVLTPRMLGVIVQVSYELLSDSVNVDQILLQAFAQSFAVELDRVAMFGTGAAPQPLGVFGTTNVNSASLGANGAALANYDAFVDAWVSLKNANAADPTAAIMAPRTQGVLAKLKDTQNQPMRKPDAIQTLPMYSTTSVPINQTQGSSSLASTIIVGDWTQLLIGIRSEMRIQLLRELYAATGQYAFQVWMRADIAVAHPRSFALIKGVL